MNRRELLRALALGGAVVAGELWIPGQKLISIPKIIRTPLPEWSIVPTITFHQGVPGVHDVSQYAAAEGLKIIARTMRLPPGVTYNELISSFVYDGR